MKTPPDMPQENEAAEAGIEGTRLRNLISPLDKTVLEAGTILGKYKIIEEAGRGGMAIVYKAEQLDLKRDVAVKVMPANISLNTRFVDRFLSEAHSVAKLNHPNIVNVYEAASEGNTYYIAMEYVAGSSLYQYLNDAKPKLVDVLEIVVKLAEALSYAHNQKIIHRDLKLGNVLMKGPLTPVLIDFGLAKALEESDTGGGITRTGEIMGSPAYMAPERLSGHEADHRSDICSLGIMLYEMLTFKNPYLDQRNLHQTTYNVMEANPLPPRKLVPWLPIEVEAITLKAMAKDPDMRYASMDAFRDDIKRYLRGDAVLAKPPSFKHRVVKKIRTRAVPIIISAIVLLFSGILAGSYFIQRQRAYSNWQLVYSQPDRLSSDDWELINIDSSFAGRIEDAHRAFTLSSPGLSYVTLDNRFNRDILIEFDLRTATAGRSLTNVGAFILGDTPQNAYSAHINRGGFGASGLTYPRGEFLFQDAETGTIPWREVNRVVIERSQSTITMTVNGRQVARIHDYFRPIGRDHEQVGFFVNASEATFSNIRIFRRAIPQVPSPTLIADRFRERGDFESAIDEYTGLMVDQTTLNLALELHINIAECQIRLGRYAAAIETIEQSAHLQGNDALRARSRYLSGVAHRYLGDTAKANEMFAKISAQHATSTVAFSVGAERIANIVETINAGGRYRALALADTSAVEFPRMATHFGALHIQFLAHEAGSGNIERALGIAQRMAAIYEGNTDIITRSRLGLADAYLNAAQTAPAIEIYNQAIRTTTTSENTRRAWFALAEMYENDFDYAQADVIYTRLVREAAYASPTYWMAALKNAEHVARTSGGISRAEGLFSDIITGVHPYPLPRIVAQYYLGRITEIEFLSRWDNLYYDNSWSLYYIARKLLLQGNRDEALEVMQVLQRQLPEASWEHLRVRRILHNSSRWL